MSQETKYEKRTWVKGDRPGASDFNRIEGGVESAHEKIKELKAATGNKPEVTTPDPIIVTENAEDLIERVKLIPELEGKATVAELQSAFNALLRAITGKEVEEKPHGGDLNEGSTEGQK